MPKSPAISRYPVTQRTCPENPQNTRTKAGSAARRYGTGLAAAAFAAAWLSPPVTAMAQGLVTAEAPETETCAWGSQMSVTGGGLNLLFIDSAAAYWSSDIMVPAGASLRLRGTFPHARYMSIVTYDARRRTVDHLTDVDIQPDAGSTNPFIGGARRDAAQRGFTVSVIHDVKPQRKPTANTLYARPTGALAPDEPVRITLRVYQPDQGIAWSDIALPAIELVERDGRSRIIHPCSQRTATPAADRLERLFSLFLARRFEDMPPLTWSIFTPDGLGENIDNAYIYTAFDPKQGAVLAFDGLAPSAPRSFSGQSVMASGDLRYWSFCSSRMTTAVIDCAVDEFVPLDNRGHFRIVMTRPDDRPANAVASCGVTWLPAPSSGPGALIYRHMLPAPGFTRSIQSLGASGDTLQLGDYLPQGRYYTKQAFEAFGCPAAPTAPPLPSKG